METESHWKHDTWWFAVSFAFVCGISLGGFICSLWERHDEIIYPSPVAITEQEVFEQAIYPVVQPKRRPIEEQLAPETIRALEIQEILRNRRDPFEVRK